MNRFPGGQRSRSVQTTFALLTLAGAFLIGCASPVSFQDDTKSLVAAGMSEVFVKSSVFSKAYPTTGNIPSGTPITLTITFVNPKNFDLALSLTTSSPSLFSALPSAAPIPSSPTSVTVTFTLLAAAEHQDLAFTLGMSAPSASKTFPDQVIKVRCDAPPAMIQNFTAGQSQGSNNAFAAFTLPTDTDLASLILTYQDVTASTAATTVTLGKDDASLLAASNPDVLSSVSGTKRYFQPSVVAGHAYAFQVTAVDAAGQNSTTASVGIGTVQYTITFNGNGQDSGTAPASVTQLFNTSFVLPGSGSLVKAGFSFAGWNTQSDGSGTGYAGGTNYTVGGSNVTLYAKWTPNANTVSFNSNGGTGSMTDQTIATGATANLTSNTFTRTGYTFIGWNPVAGAGTAAFTDGQSYTIGTGSIVLYAQWSINSYSVTYNTNGATSGSAPSAVNQSYNTSFIVSGQASLAKTGSTFTGWNTAANGLGTAYSAGSTFTVPASNTIFYAQWSVNSYSVTYDGNGATSGSPPSIVNQPYTSTFSVSGQASLAQTGYSFAGWNTAANGLGNAYAAGSTYTIPASNTTLYAQWSINSYTITFNGNGGSGSSPSAIIQNYNTVASVPGAGSLSNGAQIFNGWNTAADGSGTQYYSGGSLTLTGDLTLYANWLTTAPSVLPLAAAVVVPSGVVDLTSGTTNNMFSATGIVTISQPTSVTLPSTLTNLGYLAFHDCYALASITIPASVTTMGYGVFLNITGSGLVVTMVSTTPPAMTGGGSFDTGQTIRVPAAALATYQAAAGWSAYASQMVGY